MASHFLKADPFTNEHTYLLAISGTGLQKWLMLCPGWGTAGRVGGFGVEGWLPKLWFQIPGTSMVWATSKFQRAQNDTGKSSGCYSLLHDFDTGVTL